MRRGGEVTVMMTMIAYRNGMNSLCLTMSSIFHEHQFLISSQVMPKGPLFLVTMILNLYESADSSALINLFAPVLLILFMIRIMQYSRKCP